MITMPWNYWAEDGNPKPDTVKVISTLERVLELDENHPLAIQFIGILKITKIKKRI